MIEELFAAARTGDAGQLQRLLGAEPAQANAENADGLTLLGFAAHFGHAQAVSILLVHGADVNAISHSKASYIPSNTALHAAIAGERSMDVIRLLLENGADPNIIDSNGHTCLHVAAYHDDNREMIELLIEHDADVNAKPSGGTSALRVAMQQGNAQAAETLRRHGAIE